MKHFIRWFVVVLSLIITPASFAGGWGNKVTTITGFYVWSNGYAHFGVSDVENPDGCGNTRFLTLDNNSSNFKELYATVMAAYTAGKTVQLYYNGCTQSGSYPLIEAIIVPGQWW